MSDERQRVDTLVVLGPTASGKTSLGVRLARLLGGEIGARSEPGRGSEFAFTLPLSASKEGPP